jgi:hypothetical protein
MNTITSLKGKLSSIKERVNLRKALIVFQFSIATIAFVGAIVISQQINLFLSKDLGYNKDYILSAQVPRNWTPEGAERMISIRKSILTVPVVKSATLAYEIPDGNNAGQIPIYKCWQ